MGTDATERQSGPRNTEELLDRLKSAAEEGGRVSVEQVLQVLGRRSFGPLLLVSGLLTVAPLIGDIPGVPTIVGALVLLVSVQLLFKRNHIWLPDWLLRRSVDHQKLEKAIHWMSKPAHFIDSLIKRRFSRVIHGVGFDIIAGTCVLLAAIMPAMEIVPFSANAAGLALTLMGLGVMAEDGLLASISIALILGTAGLILWQLI